MSGIEHRKYSLIFEEEDYELAKLIEKALDASGLVSCDVTLTDYYTSNSGIQVEFANTTGIVLWSKTSSKSKSIEEQALSFFNRGRLISVELVLGSTPPLFLAQGILPLPDNEEQLQRCLEAILTQIGEIGGPPKVDEATFHLAKGDSVRIAKQILRLSSEGIGNLRDAEEQLRSEPNPLQYSYVGDWRIDFRMRLMKKGEVEHHLDVKEIGVLRELVRAGGKVVTKDHLMDTVWKGSVVGDGSIHRCISGLRKCLGDKSRKPIFIQSIPRTGYRIIAPIKEVIS